MVDSETIEREIGGGGGFGARITECVVYGESEIEEGGEENEGEGEEAERVLGER